MLIIMKKGNKLSAKQKEVLKKRNERRNWDTLYLNDLNEDEINKRYKEIIRDYGKKKMKNNEVIFIDRVEELIQKLMSHQYKNIKILNDDEKPDKFVNVLTFQNIDNKLTLV